jgi:SAM-dependent methyltransferase
MGHVAEYRASTYGDQIADFYDNLVGTMFQPAATEQAVGFLADLAGTGPALELGVGTGRIAIPLAERGVAVTGVDASEAMVARLRARPGGATIPVVMGDFGELAVEGQFALIYVVFNTFFALLTQQLQVQCFRRVAERLTPGGAFVTEAFVPDLTRYQRGQSISTEHIDQSWVMLNAAQHDPTNQRISSRHVVIEEQGVRLYPVELRYAWPSELDLMAELAGLRLKERFGGWAREPFTASSSRHISVYGCVEPIRTTG